MKTSITLSKAGHYTVVIYDKKKRYFKEGLISNLEKARWIAKEALEKLQKEAVE